MNTTASHFGGDLPSAVPLVVFRSADAAESREAAMVLESVGIESALSTQQDETNRHVQWCVHVSQDVAFEAQEQLRLYREDQASTPTTIRKRVAVFGGSIFGVFVYAAVLILIATQSLGVDGNEMWNEIGQSHAREILGGGFHRVFTALTLHADFGHLMSNLAYGGVFGLMAGRILGGGIAWLTIVVAGAAGNLLNAMFQEIDHRSIGASTAVFAALGIMVAHALHPRFNVESSLFRRWSPLIGGVLMLAMTGVGGERTDVGAHVFGFVCGLVFGWAAARLPLATLKSKVSQATAGSLAFGAVVIAWAFAITKL